MDFTREGDPFEKLGIGVPTPKTFCHFPTNSVARKYEAETIALNIMVILKRTGNGFRLLSWNEYKKERKKDGGFSEMERGYFDDVVQYCISAEAAISFSRSWGALIKS